jgi:hypothetical protein
LRRRHKVAVLPVVLYYSPLLASVCIKPRLLIS